MPELKEVFEIVTKQTEPDLGAWRDLEQRQRRAVRNRKLGSLAMAGVIVLVAVSALIATREDPESTRAGTDVTPSPREVAVGFLDAYGRFDADRAIRYLAEDADLERLVSEVVRGLDNTPDDLRRVMSLLEAQGYAQSVVSCRRSSTTPRGTQFSCVLETHLLGSDEIGLGPYRSDVDIVVRDGLITEAVAWYPSRVFRRHVWVPFANWVSTVHPADAAEMYVDETYAEVWLSDASIRLWTRHVPEYVDYVTGRTS